MCIYLYCTRSRYLLRLLHTFFSSSPPTQSSSPRVGIQRFRRAVVFVAYSSSLHRSHFAAGITTTDRQLRLFDIYIYICACARACVCVYPFSGVFEPNHVHFLLYTHARTVVCRHDGVFHVARRKIVTDPSPRVAKYILRFSDDIILLLLLLLQRGVHCPWRLNSANYNTVRAADWNVLQGNIMMEFRTGYNIILYCTASVRPRTRSVLCARKSVFYIYLSFFFSFLPPSYSDMFFYILIRTTPPPPTLNASYRYTVQ